MGSFFRFALFIVPVPCCTGKAQIVSALVAEAINCACVVERGVGPCALAARSGSFLYNVSKATRWGLSCGVVRIALG